MSDSVAAPLPGFPTSASAAPAVASAATPAETPSQDAPSGVVPGPGERVSEGAAGRALTDAAGSAPEPGGRAQRAAESETLTEQGIHLCRTARWRAAIEPLRRAAELDPLNFAAFYYLGDAYNHADTLPAALEAFEAATRLRPDHWRALKGVGIVLDRMRRPQEAAAAYQRARDAQSKTVSR